jgi:hypothetical protein
VNNDLDVLGKVSNLFLSVASTTFGLDIDEIYYLILSFNKEQIELFEKLANEVADHDVNVNRVLVLGETNGILLYEILNKVCNVDWITFVNSNYRMEEIRSMYFEVNEMDKKYSWIDCFPEESSEDESEYDLVINIGFHKPVVYGPLFAYLEACSIKLLKQQSAMSKIWYASKHNDTSLLIGYNHV